jgi:hypothetical protein
VTGVVEEVVEVATPVMTHGFRVIVKGTDKGDIFG